MVVIGTPVDLAKLVGLDKPSVRVRYELEELGTPNLASVLEPFLEAAPGMATDVVKSELERLAGKTNSPLAPLGIAG